MGYVDNKAVRLAPQVGFGPEQGIDNIDVTGFIATRPTDLDKNALSVQPICHM
jgi:hypothetical protein